MEISYYFSLFRLSNCVVIALGQQDRVAIGKAAISRYLHNVTGQFLQLIFLLLDDRLQFLNFLLCLGNKCVEELKGARLDMFCQFAIRPLPTAPKLLVYANAVVLTNSSRFPYAGIMGHVNLCLLVS